MYLSVKEVLPFQHDSHEYNCIRGCIIYTYIYFAKKVTVKSFCIENNTDGSFLLLSI